MLPDPASAAVPTAGQITALADQCVRCGLCLPHCPTYRLDRNEGESPRGRIMLMQALAESRLEADAATVQHLDHCLACRRCEAVCPAHVRFGELLRLGREVQRGRVAPGWRQRALEAVLPRPGLRAAAMLAARALRAWLPGPWRRIAAPPPRRRLAHHHPACGATRGRVALFVGCLGEHHDGAAAAAAVRVLNRLGYAVDVPRTQGCCGAIHRHAGAAAPAQRLAQRNRDAFATADTIVTLASGCHESLAQGLVPHAAKVRDLLDFLAGDGSFATLPWRDAHGATVALHLPCTQRNVVRNAHRIAPLLACLPGLDVVELPDTGCCGAAGSHMLVEPARADTLRAPLLDAIAAAGAATLCSSNVGCRLHVGAGLEARGQALPVRHPIEVIAGYLP